MLKINFLPKCNYVWMTHSGGMVQITAVTQDKSIFVCGKLPKFVCQMGTWVGTPPIAICTQVVFSSGAECLPAAQKHSLDVVSLPAHQCCPLSLYWPIIACLFWDYTIIRVQ